MRERPKLTAIFLNAHSGDRFAYYLAFCSYLHVLYWYGHGNHPLVGWRLRLLTCATPIKKTFRNLKLYGENIRKIFTFPTSGLCFWSLEGGNYEGSVVLNGTTLLDEWTMDRVN